MGWVPRYRLDRGRVQVRSRRGWTMTDRLGELAELSKGLVLDGELVALGDDGLPSFPRLSERVLHGHDGIAVTYVVFDVLARRRRSTMDLPYSDRRRILESHNLQGPAWCTAETFDDGPALFAAVVEQGLEGIVAKPRSSTYRPGECDWLRIKNRSYWRFGQELELGAEPAKSARNHLGGNTYCLDHLRFQRPNQARCRGTERRSKSEEKPRTAENG